MPTSAALVDRSRLPLSEVARHVVIPEGIVDTLWFEVEERCREFGDEFDAWQDGLGQVTLGIRADGMWAATIGGVTLSIPRQVAKTFIVGRIVVALCTMFPDLTVLWTAHRGDTATMTFQRLKSVVLRPAVRGYLLPGSNQGTAIRDANGEQRIPFANGSVIMFGAREFGFGRGFDQVDIEVFDEAQILTEKALEDMVAATNQSQWVRGALLFYMGTPPRPTDRGEAFALRRAEALALKRADPEHASDFGGIVQAGDAVYIECSADDNVGLPDGPGLDDRAQIEKANASFPHRTPLVSIRRLRKNLPGDESWRREGLGVWDADGVRMWSMVGKQQWGDLSVPVELAPTSGLVCYAVKFSVDGRRVGAAVALRPVDGPVHVEAFGVRPLDEGTSALVKWLAERWRKAAVILLDGKAGTGDMRAQLIAAGVSPRRVRVATTEDVTTAHAAFLRSVQEGDLTHLGQPGLDAQVRVAGRRKIGTLGGWGWQSVTPDGDVTALDAVTLARYAAATARRRTGEGRTVGDRTANNGRRAVLA